MSATQQRAIKPFGLHGGRRSFVMDDPGDLSAKPGSLPWALAMRLQLLVTFQERDSAADHLQVMRDGFVQHKGWRVLLDRQGRPFRSWKAFCEAEPPYGLGTTPDHLDAEVKRRNALGKHGGDRKSEQAKKQVDDVKLITDGGNSREYILARLERDGHAGLIAQVYAGELSAHAAAERVGYRRQRTPLEQLQHWWTKATTDERRTFLQTVKVGG